VRKLVLLSDTVNIAAEIAADGAGLMEDNTCMARVPAAVLRRDDGSMLPLPSAFEGAGTVEPSVRGPGNGRGWRGDLQPGANALRLACDSVAERLRGRRDA
jgi:hypothetical protein